MSHHSSVRLRRAKRVAQRSVPSPRGPSPSVSERIHVVSRPESANSSASARSGTLVHGRLLLHDLEPRERHVRFFHLEEDSVYDDLPLELFGQQLGDTLRGLSPKGRGKGRRPKHPPRKRRGRPAAPPDAALELEVLGQPVTRQQPPVDARGLDFGVYSEQLSAGESDTEVRRAPSADKGSVPSGPTSGKGLFNTMTTLTDLQSPEADDAIEDAALDDAELSQTSLSAWNAVPIEIRAYLRRIPSIPKQRVKEKPRSPKAAEPIDLMAETVSVEVQCSDSEDVEPVWPARRRALDIL